MGVTINRTLDPTSVLLGKSVAGPLLLDLMTLVDTRLLVQANSGGGKSWLFRLIAEQAASQVQTIILDPEGEFATLRERLDLLVTGREGDIPTDLRSAGLLARKLVELGISAVVDLYDLKLPERRRYVRHFLESLMTVGRSHWHPMLVMIDEAHLFAPERSAGESEATDAIISLMSQGRKRGFAGCLATQRLSKLHKDAAAEANNVMVGRTWLDIDQRRAGDLLGFSGNERQGLRDLAAGEFYAFGPALSVGGIERFRAGQVTTTHPRPGERHKTTPPKASDAVHQIVSQLADLPQQADAEIHALDDAKREIVSLKAQLRKAGNEPSADATRRLEERHAREMDAAARKLTTGYEKQLEGLRSRLRQIGSLAAVEPVKPIVLQDTRPAPRPAPSLRPQLSSNNGRSIGAGERRVLIALAQYEEGVTRQQLTILSGYKRSTRDAYIQRLTGAGYAHVSGDKVTATDDGIAALGSDYDPLPTGEALREHWLRTLPEGERKVLEVTIEEYPAAASRDEIERRTGYKRSTRDAYLQRLTARQLVAIVGRGEVVASAHLFDL